MSSHSKRFPKLISFVIIGAAVIAGGLIYRHHNDYPSSDDATIDAEVVHIASQVGGRLTKIGVKENAKVRRGELLFRLEPEAYTLAVEQAEADLAIATAALATRHRSIVSETLNAKILADQKQRAQTNLDLTTRTTERLKPLASKAYVPAQQFDQAQTAQKDAATSLEQAENQRIAAQQNIGNDAGELAVVRARKAALAIAQKALRDTEVRAPHEGRIVGLTVAEGETVAPTQTLFTLVVTDQWYAVANFRESEIPHITEGDCATVYSMVDRTIPVHGIVDGIGWGVMDTERITLPKAAPYVQKSVNWVRVAQRFPVRIRLENPPERNMRLGASAVVEIRHGGSCKG